MNPESGWIHDVLRQCEDAETPRSWIRWSCLSAIAGVTSFNVYIDKFYYKLSPNIFVMLVGESGLGKGFPVWLARALVEKVGTNRVIHGRNSIQAIITECSKTRSVEGQGLGIKDARSYLSTGEFVNFVIDDPHGLSVLTEWYDSHWMGEWKNTLKSTGIEKLRGVNCNLFAASSPAHLKDKIGPADVEGGFLGRTLIPFEERRYKNNPLTIPPEERIDLDFLAEHLTKISKIKGEFSYSESGRNYFNSWYIDFREKIQPNREDKTGLLQRLHDHVLKVAMCLALSKNSIFDGLVIREDDIKVAITLCTDLVLGANKALLGKGRSAIAPASALIVNEMLRSPKHQTTREHLLNKFWGEFDAGELDKVEMTLEQGGIITISNTASNRFYQLTDRYLDAYFNKNGNRKSKEQK